MLEKVVIGDSLESKREAVKSCSGEEVLLRDCSTGTSFSVSYKSGKIKIGKRRYFLIVNEKKKEELCYENLVALWRYLSS